MIRTPLIVLMIFAAGCNGRGDPDTVNLETALKNTKSGEYSLIAISDAEGARFISFQKSWDHKKQYYFKVADRSVVLKKVSEAVEEARKRGHKIGTMGGEEILDEE